MCKIPTAMTKAGSGSPFSLTGWSDRDLALSDRCVGCGGSWSPPDPTAKWQGRWLFCSPSCWEEAKFVRYKRACIRDGRINQPDVAQAIDDRLMWILQGGYADRLRSVSQSVRAVVIARAGGRCQTCGAAGRDIDHVAGDSNDPTNMQLLCEACHRAKTEASVVLREATEEDRIKIWSLELRVNAPDPMWPADDDQVWQARQARLWPVRRSRIAD